MDPAPDRRPLHDLRAVPAGRDRVHRPRDGRRRCCSPSGPPRPARRCLGRRRRPADRRSASEISRFLPMGGALRPIGGVSVRRGRAHHRHLVSRDDRVAFTATIPGTEDKLKWRAATYDTFARHGLGRRRTRHDVPVVAPGEPLLEGLPENPEEDTTSRPGQRVGHAAEVPSRLIARARASPCPGPARRGAASVSGNQRLVRVASGCGDSADPVRGRGADASTWATTQEADHAATSSSGPARRTRRRSGPVHGCPGRARSAPDAERAAGRRSSPRPARRTRTTSR